MTQARLNKLIGAVDDDNSGTITLDELTAALRDPQVAHRFELCGITVREVQLFFSTLAAIMKAEELSIEDFTRGCLRMRGQASAMDMQIVYFQVTELVESMRQIRGQLGRLQQHRQ